MKVKLLKKLRKKSKKLKLIRGEDYQYIVTDSPRLNECVYICVNLELEYIKSNCFTKSY